MSGIRANSRWQAMTDGNSLVYKSKSKGEVQIVHAEGRGAGSIMLGSNHVTVPKILVGARVRIKLEIVEEAQDESSN